MKKLLLGLLATLSGAGLMAWGANSGFWTRGCTEEIVDASNFVFDNACQDRAFGYQLGLLLLGFVMLAYGISKLHKYIQGR